MKTFYKKMNFLKLLRLPALIFFMLALSYTSVNAQSATPSNPVCYGTCVQLLSCTFPRALQYCDSTGAGFRWAYIWGGNLHDIYDGHLLTNPVIGGDYHLGTNLVPVQTGCHAGSVWKNPVIAPGDSVYEWITAKFINSGDYIYLSIQIPGHFSGGSINLIITDPIFINGTVVNVACGGTNTGSITTTVTGGSGIYASYQWSSGQNTQNISGIGAGTYTIVVTDNNGCSAGASFTVTAPAAFTVNSTTTGVSCFGGNNGSVCVTPAGGQSPYSYVWSNGAGNVSCANNLIAGSYTVTVSDFNGCPSVKSGTVTAPAQIVLVPTVVNDLCNGSTNGSVSIAASGGSPGYTYKWSNSPLQTNNSISGLAAGTYTVTVTDTKNCTTTSAKTVSQPALLSITPTVTNILCNGSQTGSITLVVTGGTTPYGYLWNTGANTQNLLNKGAGTYTVTVTDANLCTAVSGGTITQPPALLITNMAITNVKCTGDQTGAINITVSGGTTPIHYLWSNSTTSQNLGPVVAGTYTVTVTDFNGCTTTGSGTITQPANLPQFQATITNVACYNVCNGAITVTPSGGTPGYTYIWGTSPVQTTQNVSGLCAGNYNLTVTDINGCKAIGNNSITQPAAPLTAVPTVTNILCNGQLTGSITLSVSGGTTAYSFMWNTGFSGQNLLGAGAGTYTVTVTDAHLCTTVSGGTISQPAALLITNISVTNVKCTGDQSGAVNITVTGGTTPIHYLWSNSATTQNIGPIVAGTYTVTVTDFNGCSTTGSGTVTQPATLPQFQATITNVACYNVCNGAITVTPSGGTPGYTYIWGTSPVQTTQNVSGLCAGNYNLTVTDINGCKAIGNNSITQPAAPLTAVPTVTNILCNGQLTGSITLSVSGGTTAYSFMWNTSFTGQNLLNVGAGTYTVTVTDAHLCSTVSGGTISQPALLQITNKVITNVKCTGDQSGAIAITVTGGTTPIHYLWSNSATTQNLGPIVAGTYTVTVTDFNGCSTTTSGTVTQPATLPQFQATITNVACYNVCTGAITVTPSGGTPGYTYIWGTSPVQTTQNVSGLCAGNYNLTVTDANGCKAIGNNSVTQPAAPLTVVPSVTHVLCNGAQTGAITITVSGGTPAYAYMWNNGYTGSNLLNVGAGTYTVTVTDAHLCSTVSGGTITQPPLLQITNTVITNVKCTGDQSGAIAITVTGGTSPITYHWSNSATTQNLGPIVAGTYTVTVTDFNGCSTTTSGTITQPPTLPQFQATITNVSCYGMCNGAISVTPSGGTPGYTYIWGTSPVQTTQNVSGLCAGNYNLTVTDANGCKAIGNNSVTQPEAPLAVSITPTNITCYQGMDGSITSTVTGGTPAYTYLWNNGQTTASISNLTVGNYCVTVTDAHNCMTTGCASISQPPEWHPCFPCPLPNQCQGDTVRYCVCATGFWCNHLRTLPTDNECMFYPSSFEWTVTGGVIIQGCCDSCITVVWNHCDSGTICVTEIRHDPPYNGCRQTKCCTVNLNPVPTPMITGPLTVWADSTTMYTTTYSSCYLYSWSVTGGVVVNGQGTNTIWVHWTACGTCNGGMVKVCATDQCHPTMCCGCSSINITITPSATANLQGYVTYDNPYSTPLDGVVIQLLNAQGTVVGMCTTGPNFASGSGQEGYYSFSNVPMGIYTMHITFNGQWGGVNATDALLIELYTAHMITLTGLPLLAGDVTADMVVNATDALWVKLRTVGMVNYFPAGDWVFNNGSITIPSTGITNYPIMGLCYGDVNMSYIPQGMKEGSMLNVVDDGIQNIPVNQSFNYTVKANKSADLGAITLFLGYDKSRFEVQNVSTSVDGLKYNITDNKIAVAWSNTKPLTLNSGDPILTLQMKAKETISTPSQIFSINSGSEVADASARVLQNFDLKMSSVLTPGNGNEFSIYNYPNPFQNSTEIVYTIPEQGHVKLVITNMFGTVLSTLVDADQAAGSYQLKVDPSVINLSSGVYLYKIVVDGVTTSFNKTNKMLFTR